MAAQQQTNMDDMAQIPPSSCLKVFIHRDYSEGTGVKFQTKFPPELEGKVDRGRLEQTVRNLNNMYAEAEMLTCGTCCESCFACLTAYISYLCMDTSYEKMLKQIARYIQRENEETYIPKGLMLVNPEERGLRVLEICVLNETQ